MFTQPTLATEVIGRTPHFRNGTFQRKFGKFEEGLIFNHNDSLLILMCGRNVDIAEICSERVSE